MNIQKHDLVPKHKILSQKEKEEFLNESKILPKDLPRIFVSDTSIKEMNPTPGDIVEIIRESLIAGKVKYYRVVVVE